jgi:hypothetical protein
MKMDTFLSDNTGSLPGRLMFVVVYDIRYDVMAVSWLEHSEL